MAGIMRFRFICHKRIGSFIINDPHNIQLPLGFFSLILSIASIFCQMAWANSANNFDESKLKALLEVEAYDSALAEVTPYAGQGSPRAQFWLGKIYDEGWGVGEDDTAASEWYRLAAEQGDINAQFILGLMYDEGEGVTEDNQEAIKWYRLAAEQGDAQAQVNLGLIYDLADGVVEDNQEAIKWYRLAAAQGAAEGQRLLGAMYDDGEGLPEDNKEAIRWYRLAAEQGDDVAQVLLGQMYDEGEGIAVDDSEAVKWYKLAAQQGNAEAQNNLGVMYEYGEGIEKNSQQAVFWYEQAASQGFGVAQFNLGLAYEIGDLTAQDINLALKWYEKAAENGIIDAPAKIGTIFDDGVAVPENNEIAVQWYRKSAEMGDPKGQRLLGWMYDHGQGVPENKKQAFEWYQKAAEQNDAVAQRLLGWMYDKGEGVEEDDEQAIRWYLLAAEQGDATAQNLLGNMFFYGDGVEESLSSANEWYRKAAEQGNADGQVNIGLAYDFGEGFEEDNVKAIFWYEKAANQGHAGGLYLLGTMYDYAEGVPEDNDEALKWYHAAAENGSDRALNRLGWIYRSGDGVAANEEYAEKLFLKAVANGHAQSSIDLGYLYTLERFIEGKTENGIKLLSEAASKGSLEALTHLSDYFISSQDIAAAERTLFSDNFDFSSDKGFQDIERLWLMQSLRDYYASLQVFNKAVYFSKAALSFAEKHYGNSSAQFFDELVSLSHLQLAANDNVGALRSIKSYLASEKFLADIDLENHAYLLVNLAYSKLRLGIDPTQDFSSAKTKFQELQNDWGLGQIDLGEAEYFLKNGECEKADERLSEAFDKLVLEELDILDSSAFHWNINLIYMDMCMENYKQAQHVFVKLFNALEGRRAASEVLLNSYSVESQVSHRQQLLEAALRGGASFLETPKMKNAVFQLMQNVSGKDEVSQSFLTSMVKSVEPKLSFEVQKAFQDKDTFLNFRNRDVEAEHATLISSQKSRAQIYRSLKITSDNLRARNDNLYELLFPQSLSIDYLQSRLQNKEIFLYFHTSSQDERIYVVAISKDSTLFYESKLKQKDFTWRIIALRNSIDLSRSEGLLKFDFKTSYDIYDALLGPAEKLLNEADHLIVSSSGFLESFPFNILISEPLSDYGEDHLELYPSAAWLPKSFTIQSLSAPSSLNMIRGLSEQRIAMSDAFIGFGDPILEGQPSALRGLEIVDVYEGAKADLGKLRALPELPDTGEELRSIAEFLGAPPANVFLRENATEAQVKSTSLNRSSVIAFATHGLISGELNGLAEPALVMTPPDKATEYDDGLLTASEVAQLDLNADIVLLSACNTGAGKELGASGLSGLARSFIYAGARSLLVTHWSVDSKATTKLTTGMFEAMASDPSIGRAEALRRSMLNMINDDENPHYAHPAFWAPFSLIGDGQTAN
ncbi:MAG: CHAT domain-containing protein [Rhodobacteraceae bacterium]|nr:CHAT domain-containing protein [Paracoccaceae bacterium]